MSWISIVGSTGAGGAGGAGQAGSSGLTSLSTANKITCGVTQHTCGRSYMDSEYKEKIDYGLWISLAAIISVRIFIIKERFGDFHA